MVPTGELEQSRADTDQSLDAERSGPTPLDQSKDRQTLDDLIERDRIAADRKLWKFRASADSLLAYERSFSAVGATLTERAEADEHTKAERNEMDALLGRERDRADAGRDAERQRQDADQAGTIARRRDTDAQLVAERRRGDATLRSLAESQASLAQAKGEQSHERQVLAVVTHDLRGPLSIIAANAEFMVETSQEPPIRDAAEDVVRAAARMERLLTDLIDAARIESGTLRIVKASHDASALAAQTLHSYEPLFASRRMVLQGELPVGSAIAAFDYDRIVQVLSNLLGNALKFTPQDGTVTLGLQRKADGVEFAVRDNGPGIAATDLPHIFEKFWKMDSDTRRGLGLGLHICKSIIDGHGGRIWVESAFGQGAAFLFRLPARPLAVQHPGEG